MATFGKTGQGGTELGIAADRQIGCRFGLPKSASITSISVYVKQWPATTPNLKCAIYSDLVGAPNVLQGQTEQLTVGAGQDGWMIFNFSSPISLSAGYYWLYVWTSASVYLYYDAGAANQYALTVVAYNSWQDPYGAVDSYLAREVSIYATYTSTSLLFESSFETADISEFTGSSVGPGDAVDVIQTEPRLGNYHLRTTSDGSGGGGADVALVYKALLIDVEVAYNRIYFKLVDNTPPSNGDYHGLMSVLGATAGLAVVYVYNNNGVLNFRLAYWKNGAYVYSTYTGVEIEVGRWYAVELYVKSNSATGAVTLKIGGVEAITDSGFDNSDRGAVHQLNVGEVDPSIAQAHKMYFDCVKMDDAEIGVISVSSASKTSPHSGL